MDRLRREREGSGSSGSSADSQPVRVEVREGADGTQQVTEVRRKRKRRSHQPKKVKERRLKTLKKALLLGGIPLLIGLVALYALMLSRVKGEGFRTNASERLTELAGVPIELGRFKMSGMGLESRSAKINGSSGSLFNSAEVIGLKSKMQLSTLLSSDWNLDIVHAAAATVRFGRGGSGQRVGSAGLGKASANLPDPQVIHRAGIGLDSDPESINTAGLNIGRVELYWDGNRPVAQPFIGRSSVSIGDPSSLSPIVSFTGGELNIPSWPPLTISSISGEMSNGIYKVRRSSLEHRETGLLELAGNIDLAREGDVALKGTFSNIAARKIVHPYWSDKLSGIFEGDIEVKGQLRRSGSTAAEGSFTGRNVVFGNNPLMKRLSIGAGDSRLARIEFRSFSGRFRRMGDRIEFYDIQGEHQSMFRFRGKVAVLADGTLEGEFEVGLPLPVLDKMEGGKPVFFGPDIEGFCWSTANIGGLVDEPRDDLSSRMSAATAAAIEESSRSLAPVKRRTGAPAPSGAGTNLPGAFDRLTRPAQP